MPRTFPVDGDISLAYATPVLSRVMPQHRRVNSGLRALILDREEATAGVIKSNVGGWHSENDLLRWESPDVPVLLGWFGQAVKTLHDFSVGPEYVSGEMDASAWANVSRRGHYHQPHFHPASDWSGVYYVATGNDGSEPTHAGRIELLDPRAGVGMLDTPGRPFTGRIQYVPEPGFMLVFPSWVTHYVHPHAGPTERISIALNARMVSVKDPPKPFWKRS